MRVVRIAGILPWSMIILLTSCAVFNPARQQPEVRLTSIQPLPRAGLEQRFLIGLNIVNPNSGKLNIAGMSYALWLNGHKVASGVSGEMVAIPGYSESRVLLEAGTNLISSLRVVTELLRQPQPTVDYQFETSLRTAWWPVPVVLTEGGTITMSDYGITGNR